MFLDVHLILPIAIQSNTHNNVVHTLSRDHPPPRLPPHRPVDMHARSPLSERCDRNAQRTYSSLLSSSIFTALKWSYPRYETKQRLTTSLLTLQYDDVTAGKLPLTPIKSLGTYRELKYEGLQLIDVSRAFFPHQNSCSPHSTRAHSPQETHHHPHKH